MTVEQSLQITGINLDGVSGHDSLVHVWSVLRCNLAVGRPHTGHWYCAYNYHPGAFSLKHRRNCVNRGRSIVTLVTIEACLAAAGTKRSIKS